MKNIHKKKQRYELHVTESMYEPTLEASWLSRRQSNPTWILSAFAI